MGTKTTTKTNDETKFETMADGIQGPVAQQVSTITLGNVSYTPKQLATKFLAAATACGAVTSAVSAAAEARTARKAALATTNPLFALAKTWVKLQFSQNPTILAACGVTVKARTKPTAQTTVEANAKRQKTRAAKKGNAPAAATTAAPAAPATGTGSGS